LQKEKRMIVVDPSNYFNENYLIEYFNNHIRRKKGGGRDNLTGSSAI
jgi:hypothetical protein